MKIKVVSDLHLEFQPVDIPNHEGTDVLVLSGDILVADGFSKLKYSYFREFLTAVSSDYKHVVYVAGNHEFYHGAWNKTLDILAKECGMFKNVNFLENSSVVIDNVTFLGGTLWTDMNKQDPTTLLEAQRTMNDYRVIRKDLDGYSRLHPIDTVQRHRQTLAYIQHEVDSNRTDRYVVIGHHSPSHLSCHPDYANDWHINGCYHSDLSNTILDRPKIKLWTHGHTHHVWDYMIGETRVICNPRGYVGYENTGWDKSKVVVI
jgi:predicted phosphodiesterase